MALLNDGVAYLDLETANQLALYRKWLTPAVGHNILTFKLDVVGPGVIEQVISDTDGFEPNRHKYCYSIVPDHVDIGDVCRGDVLLKFSWFEDWLAERGIRTWQDSGEFD